MLAHGQETYTGAALGEWQRVTSATGRPLHLYRGIGFAAGFYAFAPGRLEQRLALVRVVHLVACATVVLAAAWYWLRRRLLIDYRFYALLTLKVYLATFYAFVQVPYTYLTSLVVFMSLPLLLWAGGRQRIPQREKAAQDAGLRGFA